jgi:hypothetical protein
MSDRFDFEEDFSFHPLDPNHLDRSSLNYSSMSTETLKDKHIQHSIEELDNPDKVPRKSQSMQLLSEKSELEQSFSGVSNQLEMMDQLPLDAPR